MYSNAQNKQHSRLFMKQNSTFEVVLADVMHAAMPSTLNQDKGD